jgi:hypothetical protein
MGDREAAGMKALRIAVAACIAAAIPLLASTPAQATVSGPCTASATIHGVNYNATITKATIPRKGPADWKGSVSGKGGKRAISGNVKLHLPFITLTLGSWGKTSDTYSNSGSFKYNVPKELAGFDIPLTGVHKEPGVVCTGAVIIRFQGSGGLSNPAVIASLVITVISGVGLFIALKPKGV